MTDASDHEAYEKIKHEHEHLREVLKDVRDAFAGGQASIDRLPNALEALRNELDEHFALEESTGYFSAEIDVAPRLASQAESLLEQHQHFRDRLEELIRRCRESTDLQAEAEQLQAAVDEFTWNLLRHEAEENDLIQQAYTEDIGSKD